MLGFKRPSRVCVSSLALFGTALFAACSGGGGGGSAVAPQASPTSNGSGPTVTLDQHVNFTVVVPPPSTGLALAAAHRKSQSATAAITNPYVSPNTASVELQLTEVNAVSLPVAPPPVIVNVTCPGTTGCSIPIQNVPAATGIDHFAVQTWSAAGGTGNQISVGALDISVPSAQATSFGGTALTIGGFVQTVSLVLNIPGGAFTYNVPGTGILDVNAIDTAGAIIIGTDQLSGPIQLTLPPTDINAFSINTAQQITLQQPAQAVTLAYNGNIVPGATLQYTYTDPTGAVIPSAIPIPLLPPTPPPTAPPPPPTAPPSLAPGQSPPPPPPPRQALSLYVYDGSGDRVLEYSGIIGVEAGAALSVTPRRVFEIAAPPALAATVQGCISGSPTVAGMAVSLNGTIYAQTTCYDAATNQLSYTFTYASSTQETVPVAATPIPPIPTSVITVNPATSGAFNQATGLALDEPHNTLLLQFVSASNSTPAIIGLQLNNPLNQKFSFGSACLQELGQTLPCASNNTGYASNYPISAPAVDATGNIYLDSNYNAYDSTFSNPLMPPGSTSEQFQNEPAILLFPPMLNNAAPSPLSALAGFHNELGSTATVDNIAIENSTLYVLAAIGASQYMPANGSPSVNPGLSGCPPYSANATPDGTVNSCVSGALTDYLIGYSTGPQTLLAAANAGLDVVSPPTLMVGGDIPGGFTGYSDSFNGTNLVVRDGFAYVLNGQEIDVYNVASLTGYHTDIPPVTRLALDPSVAATSIAIGPTGTGLGGVSLLRRPARVHHDVKAWARKMQERRRAMQQRRTFHR